MTNTESNGEYLPNRASAQTEQARLVGAVNDIRKRLTDAQAKSETAIDPSYARLAYTLGKQLDAAREKVRAFGEKQRMLDSARTGAPATEAGEKTQIAAEKFEKALLAAASAAAELTADAAHLAKTLHVTDQEIWPSRNSVNDAIRSRVITVFGNLSTIKLPGFGSTGKTSPPLPKRFESK